MNVCPDRDCIPSFREESGAKKGPSCELKIQLRKTRNIWILTRVPGKRRQEVETAGGVSSDLREGSHWLHRQTAGGDDYNKYCRKSFFAMLSLVGKMISDFN